MNYTGPRNGVTQSWRACAGPKASNVPIVVSKAIAWSSAARACYFYCVINAIGLQVVVASTDSMDIARGILRARR